MIHEVKDGGQCCVDQTNYKQHQWHSEREGKKPCTEASSKYLGAIVSDDGSKPGKKPCTAASSKYLGAIVSDDGSKPEVFSRIAALI